MLGQTIEFNKFSILAEDSGQSIRFMNPDKQPTTCHYPKKQSVLKDFKGGEEVEDWIPEEAFKLAHDFRNKCASNVQKSLMN